MDWFLYTVESLKCEGKLFGEKPGCEETNVSLQSRVILRIAGTREILRFVWNPVFRYRVHKCPWHWHYLDPDVSSPILDLIYLELISNLILPWRVLTMVYFTWKNRVFELFFNRLVFLKTQRFGNWICFRHQVNRKQIQFQKLCVFLRNIRGLIKSIDMILSDQYYPLNYCTITSLKWPFSFELTHLVNKFHAVMEP
jgi:hypothetical protein